MIVYLPVGATALGEPWPSQQSVSNVRFLNKIIFYSMGLLAPCPTHIMQKNMIVFMLIILGVLFYEALLY
jgi:hypothetical protein